MVRSFPVRRHLAAVLLLLLVVPGSITSGLSPDQASAAGKHAAAYVTHVHVPSQINGLVGSTTTITVHVTADGTNVTPTGYVALWNVNIPKAVTVVSHTAGLDANGYATFELRDPAPGVPFTTSDPSIYYVPTYRSSFEASTSPKFTLEVDRWPVTVSATPASQDGNGVAFPLQISVTGANTPGPVGDLAVSDTSAGGACSARFDAGLLYSSDGQATLDLNLPTGDNEITVSYLGDAFYASQQSTQTSIPIANGGRTDGTCPAGWAVQTAPPLPSSLSGGDLPMLRYGVPHKYGIYNPAPLNNPDVGTMVIPLNWSDIEPAAGVYDFTRADAEVQAALDQGKKIALDLRFQGGGVLSGSTSNCLWNFGHAQLMPLWAANQLGAANSFCSHGTALTIPKYWSAQFLTLWSSFVAQVATHYAPDSADIAYVRAPLGLGDDAIPITGPDGKTTAFDMHHLMSWGFNPQLWEAWQEDMLSAYQQAFSYAPWVLYSINKQPMNNRCNDALPVITLNPGLPTFAPREIACTGRPVEVDVAEWAVNHGFGLSQDTLNPSWVWRDPNKSNPPAGHINTILNYAQNHSPRPLIALQTFLADSYWCNLGVPTGLPPCSVNHSAVLNAVQDISYARSHGATTIEWYEDDLVNPLLQPVVSLWRQLQAVPGRGKVPTMVTVTPAADQAQVGSMLNVNITVEAPGIAGFSPGGTVTLFDDITDRQFKVIQLPIGKGSVNVSIRMPSTSSGHLNLGATYVDVLTFGGQRTGTYLFTPSESPLMHVTETR
jgi:hypothetical protein